MLLSYSVSDQQGSKLNFSETCITWPAACLLLHVLCAVLSLGVLERPYCQLEIRHALSLKKPIVLLHGA